MNKLTIEQCRAALGNISSTFEKRAAAKLQQPTELDPRPTEASCCLRAAAGSLSRRISALRAVARQYNLKYRVSKNQTGWDIEAAEKLVAGDMSVLDGRTDGLVPNSRERRKIRRAK